MFRSHGGWVGAIVVDELGARRQVYGRTQEEAIEKLAAARAEAQPALMEFESRRPPGRRGPRRREEEYYDVQAPPLLPFTTRLRFRGCGRCAGALSWDELEECYGCLQCGARA